MTTKTVKPKKDQYLQSPQAIDLAREALTSLTKPYEIGEFLGLEMIDERLGTLYFTCELAGYVGWRWAVTVARVPRGRHATVCETELLPGPDSLLAPAWVPWSQRLRPGDLRPGDVLPHILDDARLEPGWQDTSDDADQLAIWELGLGRPRVLSYEGWSEAATRWAEGIGGPHNAEADKATAKCATCGFAIPGPGRLRLQFAICANEWSPRDGHMVTWDHGCGAHSETDLARRETQWPPNAPMVDDSSIIAVEL